MSKVNKVLRLLEENYPEASTALHYNNAFQLLIAVVLSARSTDQQVNKITPVLFEKYGDAESLAKATPADIEKIIKTCGLYKNKAQNLISLSQVLLKKYDGQVPQDINELLSLPGVGRKTANVVVSNAFGQPAIAVDTHVYRVSKRIGIARGTSVEKVEKELMDIIPRDLWTSTHHRLIIHGRNFCLAKSPKCKECFLNLICTESSS